MTSYGPGFRRMRRRLGEKALEALRRDNLQRQLAAREEISGELIEGRDRTTYNAYPPVKPKRGKGYDDT